MKTKIEVAPMWELDRINVYLAGIDSEDECTFFVPSRPVLHQRSNPRRGTYEHGFATHDNLDLTVDQAEALAHQLLNAVQQMREMDLECEAYFDSQEESDA